jgi:hypothetical protein
MCDLSTSGSIHFCKLYRYRILVLLSPSRLGCRYPDAASSGFGLEVSNTHYTPGVKPKKHTGSGFLALLTCHLLLLNVFLSNESTLLFRVASIKDGAVRSTINWRNPCCGSISIGELPKSWLIWPTTNLLNGSETKFKLSSSP